jgi:hypothetical protein
MPGDFIPEELTEAMWEHVGRVEEVAPEDVVAVTLAVLSFPRLPEVVEATRRIRPGLYRAVPEHGAAPTSRAKSDTTEEG